MGELLAVIGIEMGGPLGKAFSKNIIS